MLGAASVLQCHGVLLFRNRPLDFRPKLRCGAVLRAWELQFGAGFLSVQKATLGSGACLLGAASILQCHGVLLFRNRPLELRCGAVLRAWELHFGVGFLSGPGAELALFFWIVKPRGSMCVRNRSVLQYSMVFRCGEGCVLEACSISSSSTTSSSSRRSSSSSRPSSCNRFVLNRIQKDPEVTSSLGATCFWRSFRPSIAWCFGVARGTLWKPAAPAQQQQRQQQQQAQQLNSLCFLPESRRGVKPRDTMFLEVVPSRSVLQGHCVLLFRNRPLGLGCELF